MGAPWRPAGAVKRESARHWKPRPALLLALALLAPLGACAAPDQAQRHTELATLASSGDVVQLWRSATDAAAAAVVDALRQQLSGSSVELKGSDLDELRIWRGQSVTLGVEVDGQPIRFVVQSEPEWRRLAEVLPAQQGGLLPAHDWDSIDRDWLSPVARGSLLPDFALEGPVDVYLAQPTALQLFLPHATDAGTVHRVMLRQGAAVMVRGARAVRLRRGLDLPPISLSEFAGIVTSDAGQQQPLGIMHLLSGVRQAAAAHWNESHPDQSLGLVALEVDFAPRGAALLAAPSTSGGSRRLKARPVKAGVVELLPRDGVPAAGAADGAVAVPGAEGAPEGAWPLTSVHPMQLQSYERLLRQVIGSRLFRADPPATRSKGAKRAAPPPGGKPTVRVAQDVQLRLLETEAQATTLLQMQLDLVRRPLAGAGKERGQRGSGGGSSGSDDSTEGGAAGGAPGGQGAGGSALAVMEEAPDALQILQRAATRQGPWETWTATVQVKGDAARGTLKFVPLMLQRVGAAHDTVQFAPDALHTLFGAAAGNATAEHGVA